MTATAHINCGCIRFDQFQLAVEGRYFLALGTSTFTLHNSFASFNAQVVGSADVRVKFTLSPTGSSLPPPSSLKELESQNSCHQAPIRRTSEPYSSSGMLHTRYEIGHSCQANHRACLLLPQRPKPRKHRRPRMCSCRTQKRRGFPGYSSLSSSSKRREKFRRRAELSTYVQRCQTRAWFRLQTSATKNSMFTSLN